MALRYYFAPMEGLTDRIYRRIHNRIFPGVDRYYMPFLSPTVHRALTHREELELPMADSVPFTAIPQGPTKTPADGLHRGEPELGLSLRNRDRQRQRRGDAGGS